jgi:predicted ATPase
MTAADQGPDHISEIRIRGVRCIEDITLRVEGLTVLIGPNGSGKSTIVEVAQLLHLFGQSGWEERFFHDHGGPARLVRQGEASFSLGLTIGGAAPRVRYDVTIAPSARALAVRDESLVVWGGGQNGVWLPVVHRGAGEEPYFVTRGDGKPTLTPIPDLAPTSLAIHSFGQFPPNVAITRLIRALQSISVQVPFDVRAGWTTPNVIPALRQSNVLRAVDGLERFGANLANAWHRLKNDFGPVHWGETMLEVRAGLGEDVEDVSTQADPSGGQVALKVRFASGAELPAHVLSDGMLVYLAFVALARLSDPRRSLLVFDEPELHLHPELLARVVGLLQEASAATPVLLTTHSDRLLDALADPAASVVLCDLDPQRRTRLLRPDRASLHRWLEDYRLRGVGDLRAQGYEASVFTEDSRAAEEASQP